MWDWLHDSIYKSESPEALLYTKLYTLTSHLQISPTFFPHLKISPTFLPFWVEHFVVNFSDDLGTSPPFFFVFFFVKDLKMKIQTLNEQALVFFGGHGWMVWDGIGIRSHNPTLVGLDPFGAGDDGIFTRKDGFRMIQKLKQPVKNALYHCFLPSWRLMKQHHTTCPLARTYVYTSSLDL